jgi:hypothetical protein
MPRNKIPEFFHPEIRRLIERSLEDAWQELKNRRSIGQNKTCNDDGRPRSNR